eukprot:403372183
MDKQTIENQQQLQNIIFRFQNQTVLKVIKFTLLKNSQEKKSEERNNELEFLESCNSNENLKENQSQKVHPYLIVQLLKVLQEKGVVTSQDVKLLHLSNLEQNQQKNLNQQIDHDQMKVIIDQSTNIVSEIVKFQPINQIVKSEGDLAQSQVKGAILLPQERYRMQQSYTEAETKLSQYKEKEPVLSLREFIKNNKQNHNRSHRQSFHSGVGYSGLLSSRARANSGQQDTPTGNYSGRKSTVIQNKNEQQQLNNKGESFESGFLNDLRLPSKSAQQTPLSSQQKNYNKAFTNPFGNSQILASSRYQQLLDEHKPETDISLIEDTDVIMERSESLEISMALNESRLDQSYMK